mmetsp:Transcript_106652/g.311777  ORF Transcript_106652/g.311777 Transcript_106652/m.311777 type:complete len:373 (-) Transcript_106652:342-1460(-)
MREPVDADEQGVVQQALPAQELRVRPQRLGDLHLVFRRRVHYHGYVHPLPVAQRSVARRPLAGASASGHLQQLLLVQGPPVRRGALEVEDQPHGHRQEVPHNHKVHPGGVLPSQWNGVTTEVLDEGSASSVQHVSPVRRQDAHVRVLLAAGDLLDDEARGHALRGVAEHAVEEGARRALGDRLPELLNPPGVQAAQVVWEVPGVLLRRDVEGLADGGKVIGLVVLCGRCRNSWQSQVPLRCAPLRPRRRALGAAQQPGAAQHRRVGGLRRLAGRGGRRAEADARHGLRPLRNWGHGPPLQRVLLQLLVRGVPDAPRHVVEHLEAQLAHEVCGRDPGVRQALGHPPDDHLVRRRFQRRQRPPRGRHAPLHGAR